MTALVFILGLLWGYVTPLLYAWSLKKYNTPTFYRFFFFAIPSLLLPLFLPQDQTVLRVLMAINNAVYALKMWDLYVDQKRGIFPTVLEINLFLQSSTTLVRRRMNHEAEHSDKEKLHAFLKASVIALFGAASMATLNALDLSELGFWREHCLKMLAFYGCIDGGMRLISSIQRILLGRSREMTLNPILAHSPADFWRRYNRSIGQFLFEHVFRPLKGTRRPFLATLAVFFVSALLHEYIFGIALLSVQVFQTAFFMTQGFAVALSQRWKPRGVWRVLGIVGTFVFNVATLSLFFASGEQVFHFQFYDSATPFDPYFPKP